MQSTDQRILRLIEVLILQNKVNREIDFCRDIGILPQTVSKIRKGINHFTVSHIETICIKYNVNANWLFGRDKKVFNMSGSIEIEDFLQ
ncbi:XRE family transcriptional regulator [Flavobacterium cupreum]|uniref:XRE family transcriptional regulator n=1 Tax=Flavobacterium cupreum TaxID=2133766 RepID=A0A434A2R9_9FLAO|nr:helix-turn-helix transcriptional regulator [Flavobacterium sp. P3160]RUT68636.1 XRE family transcriptional regulator [Flavobacterium cupreum]